MSSHFIHWWKYFIALSARSFFWKMFVLHVIWQFRKVFFTIWAEPWSIDKFTYTKNKNDWSFSIKQMYFIYLISVFQTFVNTHAILRGKSFRTEWTWYWLFISVVFVFIVQIKVAIISVARDAITSVWTSFCNWLKMHLWNVGSDHG